MHRALISFVVIIATACQSSKPAAPGPSSAAKSSWLVGDNGLMLSIGTSGEARTRGQVTATTLNGLMCVDHYTAWAVGDHGEILYTTDSGAHWTHQFSGTTASLYAVSFSSAQHGVAAGEGGTLLETDDGGAHWQVVSASAATDTFRAVSLSSSSGAGIAVGDDGLVAWSNDGGRSWVPHPSLGAISLTGVDLNDDDVAVAVGRGGAAFRIDQTSVHALSWSQVSVRDLAAVRFLPDGDHLFAVGAQGTILQSQLSTGLTLLAQNPSLDDLDAVTVFGGEFAHYDDSAPVSIMAAGANGVIVAGAVDTAFERVPSHTTAIIRALDELSGD